METENEIIKIIDERFKDYFKKNKEYFRKNVKYESFKELIIKILSKEKIEEKYILNSVELYKFLGEVNILQSVLEFKNYYNDERIKNLKRNIKSLIEKSNKFFDKKENVKNLFNETRKEYFKLLNFKNSKELKEKIQFNDKEVYIIIQNTKQKNVLNKLKQLKDYEILTILFYNNSNILTIKFNNNYEIKQIKKLKKEYYKMIDDYLKVRLEK